MDGDVNEKRHSLEKQMIFFTEAWARARNEFEKSDCIWP
jgi:hypothetical protein